MTRTREDITGQRFGRLVAVRPGAPRKWLFRCDCGTEKEMQSANVKSGNTTSCGCARKNRFRDILGATYGKLTAVEYLGNGTWRWQCDCGNTTKARFSDVENRKKNSCGCHRYTANGHYDNHDPETVRTISEFKRRTVFHRLGYDGQSLAQLSEQLGESPKTLLKTILHTGDLP